MQFATVDIIIRRTLLERNLPLHWYTEMLYHTSAAVRELSKDTLKIVNTVNLVANEYGAIDLPSDFVDDVALSLQVGGLLQPLPHKDSINPMRQISSTTGQFVPYTNTTAQGETEQVINNQFFWGSAGWVWYWNVNDYGEPTGRFFGANGGTTVGYKVIKERRQIQLTAGLGQNGVVLMYISNGQSSDNATQVEWMAFAAIQAYVAWKMSANHASKDSYEARTYYNEKRLLRAQLSELTITDIKNVLRSNFVAAIKN